MDPARRLAATVRLLRDLGHGCALVGGVAVGLRARQRFTKDVDLAVASAGDRETEAVAVALQRAGHRLLQVFEHRTKGMITTLRFGWPDAAGDGADLDLLFAVCGIEADIVAAAEPVSLGAETPVPVARLHHLIAMKLVSESDLRDQDRGDLRELLAVASAEDLAAARHAIGRITERGFHRGKDLAAVLDRELARLPPLP